MPISWFEEIQFTRHVSVQNVDCSRSSSRNRAPDPSNACSVGARRALFYQEGARRDDLSFGERDPRACLGKIAAIAHPIVLAIDHPAAQQGALTHSAAAIDDAGRQASRINRVQGKTPSLRAMMGGINHWSGTTTRSHTSLGRARRRKLWRR